MTKKAKKAKKRVRQNWCQMVIRVKVPKKDVKEGMRVWSVWGLKNDRAPAHQLEILSAYYDLPGQPDASN